MSCRMKLLSLLLVQSLLLMGCSGSGGSDINLSGNGGDLSGGGTSDDTSDDSGDSDDSDDSDDSGDSTENTSNFSFHSLSVYESFSEFSGFSADGLYQGEGAVPFIDIFMINPIVAATLTSTTLATASDYTYTVDDIEADPTESFPMLQKVIGVPASLETALVFDVSGSVNSVDFTALIAEAKAYVAAAQASTDPLIANQQYVVWAFGRSIVELTEGFTGDAAVINDALDDVIVHRTGTLLQNADSLGSQSNLHRAIVESVGRYQEDPYDFLDDPLDATDNNDLVDSVTSNGVLLSQLVLFSSGADTFLEMSQSLMIQAIESQGFAKYVGTDLAFTNKPVFYYVTGDTEQGVAYSALSDNAEVTEYLTLDAGAYSFSADLIQNQLNAVDARIDLDNQYVYRAAFLPRTGDHQVVLQANSSVRANSLEYSIDAEVLDLFINVGTPGEELESIVFDAGNVVNNGLVEITGPNGEYLSNYAASLAEVSTFLPATRWVNDEYDSGDYAWSFPDGDGVGTVGATGSYTVTSITGATSTLRLENTVLGYTTDITISN